MNVDLKGLVKALVWHKSVISSWNGDYHTVPTGYTVRCADENGWKWVTACGFGYAHSPEAAQSAANADHAARVIAALDVDALTALQSERDAALARESTAYARGVYDAAKVVRASVELYASKDANFICHSAAIDIESLDDAPPAPELETALTRAWEMGRDDAAARAFNRWALRSEHAEKLFEMDYPEAAIDSKLYRARANEADALNDEIRALTPPADLAQRLGVK